ncbi:hypothetical protein [Porphyrobacter sp. YT40]|uniref:hypothetical protein n=1 Tax=Porphyrobacter sp. YT40 TaxID=2547601 RepID=UPI001144A762|nr:hypothetical protein [Porphyrobacter sp. YT40]QDH35338.1 hypothetical protein E2E27_14035 [Porphyrobacter sp. YT40]
MKTDPLRSPLFTPTATGFALGLMIEVAALFLAVISAGAGHGSYAAARALFPVPMLTTLLEGDSIGPLSITLALAQFPTLGALAGYSLARARLTPLVVVGIVHLVAMLAAFSGTLPNFS